MSISKEEALKYHSEGRKGKIEVIPTKPCYTARELSLAYTPGVAEPCREIEKNEDDVYKYTAKGNLVSVVSNGTAVLGLGDIGPLAGKPVMEGKGVLFKRFADIDVFDIELKTHDPKEVIRAVQLLEPTFGGINLEDIKAPECFEIEEELIKTMNIPVIHDDQHGTAIISGAALINALEIQGKKIDQVKVVFSGAGAAGIACASFWVKLGVKRENIIMSDIGGVVFKGRTEGMNKYMAMFAADTNARILAEAIKGADVFMGVSAKGVVTKEMIKSMADKPIVFAMANPDPEITYEEATSARDDIIMATGRSDYPNQVNNVLGFPFIFRGALDVRAKKINEEMKMAATYALAQLAREKVPEVVINAYGGNEFSFGPEYIIPKPFDPRVLWNVAPAVAKAAMDTGVARTPITDWDAYKIQLQERLGYSTEIARVMVHKAQQNPKKVVYPEGEEEKIIRAANAAIDENIAKPILLGSELVIKTRIEDLGYDPKNFEIVDLSTTKKIDEYSDAFYKKRQRKGVTPRDVKELMKDPNYFGAMMVECGDADAMVGGLTYHYPQTIRPALQCIGVKDGLKVVSGMYIVIIKRKVYFFADCTVNIDPTAEQLAEITISTAETVKDFDIVPKIAMLSFSNFGSAPYPQTIKVANAVKIVRQKRPDLIVDGEMQADSAVVAEILEKDFPFSILKGGANVLIFPTLEAGNIAYKLLQRLTDAVVIGPILMGMKKPVHVIQRGDTVNDIINMTAIAVVGAKDHK